MRFASAALLGGLISAVSAHFHLEYPGPRGPFVANSEPNFCGKIAHISLRTVSLICFLRRLRGGHDEPHYVPAQQWPLLVQVGAPGLDQ